MSEDRLELWRQRDARIRKALNYEPVDRIPILFFGTAYAPISQGMPLSTYCTDPEESWRADLDAMDSLGDIDGINAMTVGLLPCELSGLWLSRTEIPGRELPENSLWQVREEETMKVEDYDVILNQGWEAFVGRMLAQVQKPDLVEKHNAWIAANYADLPRRFYSRGYAVLSGTATTIPFEVLCGARSMQKFFFDCHRMPDKVKAALDVAQPFYIQSAIEATDICGVRCTWVGGWRAASAMVSPNIWNRLIFPYYHDLITKLHERGIRCLLHFDHNWDRDIARFLELPRGCILALDGATNIRRAKEILGDHMVFLGDVPSSLLAAGTPDDVRRYVRELIRDLGPTGFIMNPGCDAPLNTPRANMEAYVAATHECGTYS
jgi:uroporphyrinogen-III decarboxylase